MDLTRIRKRRENVVKIGFPQSDRYTRERWEARWGSVYDEDVSLAWAEEEEDEREGRYAQADDAGYDWIPHSTNRVLISQYHGRFE